MVVAFTKMNVEVKKNWGWGAGLASHAGVAVLFYSVQVKIIWGWIVRGKLCARPSGARQ